MTLPSKDTVKDIRSLIYEITGFEEDEENFYICEQYCLSHIMHHSYPSVNRFEVKKLIDGYIHRFLIHGYFKVSEGLDEEVKKFLSHESLFRKNPEFDIQWTLLDLVTSLATNLSSVTKLPKIMPVHEDEKPTEEINWGEYLKEGLPTYVCQSSDNETDSDYSFYSQSSDNCVDQEPSEPEKSGEEKNVTIIKEVTKSCDIITSRQHIIDELVKRREEEISYKRDVVLRGNFIEELGFFVNTKQINASPQILSEFEVVGYVLNQFLTGQNVLRKKGITSPATCSLTEGTVKNYLSSIQPYVNMITVFKEFSNEVSLIESGEYSQKVDGKYSKKEKTTILGLYNNLNKMSANEKKTVPNVLKLYNMALIEALNSFESKILTMSEFQNLYTLLQVLYELRPSFNDLSTLFAVHLSATTNWLNEPNWLCSVRVIATLYKAVFHSTSNKMGFLFMNMLLFCFQAYLDITDGWISCLTLNDPHNEYIIYRTEENAYDVHPYKQELDRIGLKEIPMLDHLANKMVHVGHSIDVLHRLDRSLIKDQNESHEALYKQLLRKVKGELKRMQETFHIESGEISFSDGGLLSDNLSDNNNSCSDVCSFKTAHESSYKETMSVDSDITGKDIALSDFCIKLCLSDKNERIEKWIWPLALKIDTDVKDIINRRVLHTCDIAKDVVVNEFQLKIHLRLLRNVFLFNEPHLILPFMSGLFCKESLRQNYYVLTSLLRECIESRYKQQSKCVSIAVQDNVEPPKNILEAIDRITINYQVDWPLQLIFTPGVMNLYNNIFRHLFKLHWAHETLCKLRFTLVGKEAPDIVRSSSRRLELLRFWCLSALARLRSYFMAQISTPFDLQVNSYQHLKHVIKAHEEFVGKIHSRCLLGDDNADGKELVFGVLIPLCCDVYQHWSTERVVPDSKLTRVECTFFESQKRFTRLMSTLEDE